MSSIGGIFSLLAAIVFAAISYPSHLEWIDSLIQEVKEEEIDSDDKTKTLEIVQERVSFKGIYNLHDDIQHDMVTIDHNHKIFQSLEQKAKALQDREEEREEKVKELEAEIE